MPTGEKIENALMKRVSRKVILTNPYNQCFVLHRIFYRLHFIKRSKASIIQKLLAQKKLMGFCWHLNYKRKMINYKLKTEAVPCGLMYDAFGVQIKQI